MPNSKYSVEIFPLAEEDLENIYRYYYSESLEKSIADRVIKELKEAILGLCFMPKSNPQAREKRLRKDGFHKLICGEFVIPFLINEEKNIVSVVRVFHGKMNYKRYL